MLSWPQPSGSQPPRGALKCFRPTLPEPPKRTLRSRLWAPSTVYSSLTPQRTPVKKGPIKINKNRSVQPMHTGVTTGCEDLREKCGWGQVPLLHLATADPAGWDLGSAFDLLPLSRPWAPVHPHPRGQSSQDAGLWMTWVCILSPLLPGSETLDNSLTVSGPVSSL